MNNVTIKFIKVSSFLEIFQNSRENTYVRVLKKETLAQVFSCEFWEISKNIFFTERLPTTASEVKQNEVFTMIINRIFIFIWYQYDIENSYHYNMKFYIVLRYRYNIIMMLEKGII